MIRNKELSEFLFERNKVLAIEWYNTVDKGQGGLPPEMAVSELLEKRKQRKYELHLLFCSMFTKEIDEFEADFQGWIRHIAKDEDIFSAPVAEMLKEFFQIQNQYLQLIGEFASNHGENVSLGQLTAWNRAVTSTMNTIILEFTAQREKAAQQTMDAQQEKSVHIILLTQEIGLLPLAGELTAARAQVLFEKVLKQSSDADLEKLFIDLSGVSVIDSRVAQQLFQLTDGLKLMGVKTAFAGINPVIAQTSIQLGHDFNKIEFFNTLIQAMQATNLKVRK